MLHCIAPGSALCRSGDGEQGRRYADVTRCRTEQARERARGKWSIVCARCVVFSSVRVRHASRVPTCRVCGHEREWPLGQPETSERRRGARVERCISLYLRRRRSPPPCMRCVFVMLQRHAFVYIRKFEIIITKSNAAWTNHELIKSFFPRAPRSRGGALTDRNFD